MYMSRSIVLGLWMLLHPTAIAVAIGSQEPLQPMKEFLDTSVFNSVRPKVPGDSPIYFNGDPGDNVLQIQKLDLIPNPPDE